MSETLSPTPAPSKTSALKQKRLDRSCVLCHQRKIRCDKQSPCGNCARGDVLCHYPEAEQFVRRPQKTTIADVSVRLARLERTIATMRKGPAGKQTSQSPESVVDFNSLSTGISTVPGTPRDEKLIQQNGTSRYFNESLLSHILEEVHARP